MILEIKQILEKLQNPSSCMVKLKKDHEELLMHVHGIGVTEYLTQIEGLENSTKIKLRKRLARSNKDLFADILRPTDKIFNSQGGSKVYKLKSKSKEEKFTEQLSTICGDYGLSEWLETYFVDKLVVDPNGIFLIEHSEGEPYPTYKSIFTIKDYKQKNRFIEYIIFEPEKIDETGNYKVRVYDDAGDYTYLYNEKTLTLIEDESYPNPWGKVPGITCSDIIDTLTDYKKSTIYEQKELAGEYLRENSVKTLFKYHHGFPLFWMYMSKCPVCKGMGTINRTDNSGEIHTENCHMCSGTGWAIKKDVSDIKLIKPPESTDEPIVTPDLAGYVVPPIESWDKMSEELKLLRDMIYFSHWGTVINREDTEKTAFEVALNTQPMQDRLNKYTNSLEDTEKKLTNFIGQYYYGESYEGCSINYGRNYIIKSPNQYLTEYLEEKSKNASYSVLNGKLKSYYNAVYAHDEYNRIVNLKLIEVEPWVHNTIKEVKGWSLPNSEFAKKLYYNDWLSTIKKEEIITKTIEELKNSLYEFVKLKLEDYATEEVQRVQSTSGLVGQE